MYKTNINGYVMFCCSSYPNFIPAFRISPLDFNIECLLYLFSTSCHIRLKHFLVYYDQTQ